MVLRLAAAALLMSAVGTPNSVLSHEAIIDAAWDASIKPLLLARFPGATDADLKKAHAYAYGGAIVQDMGYYPLGSHFFSDLAHYIRSGDFIENLLKEASDVNELAFALGSIAHYAGDHAGHSIAVNRTVALLYPKLRRRFGDTVTYADDPASHLKVEFGFDVLQVAQGNFASENYHDFIGFEVSKAVLERAFQRTYAIKMEDAFSSVDLAMGTFRFSVANIIPKMTKVAWAAKKNEIAKAHPGITKTSFVYRQSRASYEKEWSGPYKRPGFFSRLFAIVFEIMPKVGPLRAFSFRLPTPEAEKLFAQSFQQTLVRYKDVLARIRRGEIPAIPNENFDTGTPVKWASYRLADEAYEKLLHKLSANKFAGVDAELRVALLDFVSGTPNITGTLGVEIAQLKSTQPAQ